MHTSNIISFLYLLAVRAGLGHISQLEVIPDLSELSRETSIMVQHQKVNFRNEHHGQTIQLTLYLFNRNNIHSKQKLKFKQRFFS